MLLGRSRGASYIYIVVVLTNSREGTWCSFGKADVEDEVKRGSKAVDLASKV
jgi:hypothetical protein